MSAPKVKTTAKAMHERDGDTLVDGWFSGRSRLGPTVVRHRMWDRAGQRAYRPSWPRYLSHCGTWFTDTPTRADDEQPICLACLRCGVSTLPGASA